MTSPAKLRAAAAARREDRDQKIPGATLRVTLRATEADLTTALDLLEAAELELETREGVGEKLRAAIQRAEAAEHEVERLRTELEKLMAGQ